MYRAWSPGHRTESRTWLAQWPGFFRNQAGTAQISAQDLPELASAGYKIVYGESDLPIALTFNEGNTLLVQKDLLHAYIGGAAVQEKNRRIFSPEGRQERKTQKRQRAGKHRCS